MHSLQAVQDPSLLDECELDEELKKVLLENIKQKLTQQAVKIRADIEVSIELDFETILKYVHLSFASFHRSVVLLTRVSRPLKEL